MAKLVLVLLAHVPFDDVEDRLDRQIDLSHAVKWVSFCVVVTHAIMLHAM